MNREQKTQLVENLKHNLGASKFVAIVHYAGINDKSLYDIRVNLKSKSCSMKIVKNNLTKIAIKDTDLEVITPHLNGPVALLYSQDPVTLSKIVLESAKKNKNLKIVTGYLDKSLINEDKIKDLAKLGSLEEVRSSFIGALNAVPSGFIRNLNYNKTTIVSLIKNYIKKIES